MVRAPNRIAASGGFSACQRMHVEQMQAPVVDAVQAAPLELAQRLVGVHQRQAQAIGDVLLYWPLVMICMGLAILLAVRENRPSRASKDS